MAKKKQTSEEDELHLRRGEHYLPHVTPHNKKFDWHKLGKRAELKEEEQKEVKEMINRQVENHESSYSDERKQHFKRSEHDISLSNNRFTRFWNRFWKWTGFGDKTLWDTLQLLGLPVVVAVIPFLINYNIQESQKKIENDRYQQAVLENYFQEMTNILVDKKLGTLYQIAPDNQPSNYQDSFSQLIDQLYMIKGVDSVLKESVVKDLKELRGSQMKELEAIARAQTLTTLNLLRLDVERRDLLVNFLRETGLVAKDPICVDVDLKNTNDEEARKCQQQEQQANLLIGIKLNGLPLDNIQLERFILKKADLGNAKLNEAFLTEADLREANLSGSELGGSAMIRTDLRGANLTNADLHDANLHEAKLMKANLGSQGSKETNLTNTNFTNANLTDAIPPSLNSQYRIPEQAEQDFPNAYLCNTTMPNGYISNRDCKTPWEETY